MTHQPMLTVHDAGWAVLQDLGRYGFTSVGVSVGGSADQYSARCANALVANAPASPLVEVTAQHLSFACDADCLIAVTGAPCGFTVDGVPAAQWQPVPTSAGATVRIGEIAPGLRVYVAFNGRLQGERVMGSVAPDRGLGLGRWLAAGDRIPITTSFRWYEHPHTGIPLIRPPVEVPPFGSPWTIDVIEGPDAAAFADAMARLTSEEYTVSPQSDTVGLRLAGATPERIGDTPGEVLSHGVAIGSVELPSPGSLLVLGRGRILTAGYPVLAVATRVAQSRLGQVRPGDAIHFRVRSLEDAVTDARREAAALRSTADAVRAILDVSRGRWPSASPCAGPGSTPPAAAR